jgi:hypothetical protein
VVLVVAPSALAVPTVTRAELVAVRCVSRGVRGPGRAVTVAFH